ILVDTVPPTTAISLSGTVGANGWYTSSVTVALNATDATSGVANISYRIDGGGWLAYTGPFPLGDGPHVVDYLSSDLAGLAETMHSQSIAVDTTPPSTTASVSGTAGANGWYLSNVTGYLSASDATSGVANLSYQVDGGSWLSYNGPFVLGEGLHTVDYFASDHAGLVEAMHSATVAIDRSPP